MFTTLKNMRPLYIDSDGVAIFTTDQIEEYGLPEENNYRIPYQVIESPPQMMASFDQILHVEPVHPKPVHRYDRFERFTTCLKQLLGIRGVIGKSASDLFYIMRDENYQYERDYMPQWLVWEKLRKVLSKHKMSKFCNRIPKIAQADGFKIEMPMISRRMYRQICSDFQEMHNIFPKIKHKLKRTYFPNIRAMCLLLMERYKIPNVLMIPIARTTHKAKELRETFDFIWEQIGIELEDLIFGE